MWERGSGRDIFFARGKGCHCFVRKMPGNERKHNLDLNFLSARHRHVQDPGGKYYLSLSFLGFMECQKKERLKGM